MEGLTVSFQWDDSMGKEYRWHLIQDCERQLAKDIFSEMVNGRYYMITTNGWESRPSFFHGMTTYTKTIELQQIETRTPVIHTIDYEALLWKDLSMSALDEIWKRIKRNTKSLSRFMDWFERAQGMRLNR